MLRVTFAATGFMLSGQAYLDMVVFTAWYAQKALITASRHASAKDRKDELHVRYSWASCQELRILFPATRESVFVIAAEAVLAHGAVSLGE